VLGVILVHLRGRKILNDPIQGQAAMREKKGKGGYWGRSWRSCNTFSIQM
jgi:hypothetical protein